MIRTIEFTVDEQSVTPAARQFAGVAGEHNATKVIFTVENRLFNKIKGKVNEDKELYYRELYYRFDCFDASGTLYSTESTQITNFESGTFSASLLLGENITRLGGEARIVLVVTLLNSNETEMELLSVPVSVYFKGVPFASGKLDESRESLTSLEQSAKKAARNAEGSAENAKESADAAENSASGAAQSAATAQAAAEEAKNQKINAEQMLKTHNTDPEAHLNKTLDIRGVLEGDIIIDYSLNNGVYILRAGTTISFKLRDEMLENGQMMQVSMNEFTVKSDTFMQVYGVQQGSGKYPEYGPYKHFVIVGSTKKVQNNETESYIRHYVITPTYHKELTMGNTDGTETVIPAHYTDSLQDRTDTYYATMEYVDDQIGQITSVLSTLVDPAEV